MRLGSTPWAGSATKGARMLAAVRPATVAEPTHTRIATVSSQASRSGSRARPSKAAAICLSTPESTTSLPSIAPAAITIVRPPKMLPSPFCTSGGTSAGGTPSAIAMPIDTARNARNGLTLAMATSATRAAMAVATMRMVMGWGARGTIVS